MIENDDLHWLHRPRVPGPWQPIQASELFTLAGQPAAIEKLLGDHERGLAVAHVVLDQDRIIGRVTLSNIVRGPFQSCNLGYWISAADNGRRHGSATVAEIAQLAFSELGLHRIEAGTLQRNIASQRVLERNGFERFGVARRYLQIAGHWQDHILFQKIAPGGKDRHPVIALRAFAPGAILPDRTQTAAQGKSQLSAPCVRFRTGHLCASAGSLGMRGRHDRGARDRFHHQHAL
jgi:ribosomal-protein-alanine N-acetyltransferase